MHITPVSSKEVDLFILGYKDMKISEKMMTSVLSYGAGMGCQEARRRNDSIGKEEVKR